MVVPRKKQIRQIRFAETDMRVVHVMLMKLGAITANPKAVIRRINLIDSVACFIYGSPASPTSGQFPASTMFPSASK